MFWCRSISMWLLKRQVVYSIPTGGNKFLYSGTESKRGVGFHHSTRKIFWFRRKGRTECLKTRLPLDILRGTPGSWKNILINFYMRLHSHDQIEIIIVMYDGWDLTKCRRKLWLQVGTVSYMNYINVNCKVTYPIALTKRCFQFKPVVPEVNAFNKKNLHL